MHVLVTGSEGFIGRHFVKHLVEKGHAVTEIDIATGTDCLAFFRNNSHKFDLALHCAAIVGGRTYIENQAIDIATNVALDSWFFRWLELSKTRRAVYFSSSAVYPKNLNMPYRQLKETDLSWDLTAPDFTYGAVKLFGEYLARQSSAKVTVVRPFSGFGEDQSSDYPFGAFIERARRHADPFEIWGNGTQTRDWIHIDDIVRATLTAVKNGITDPVNLCTGREINMNKLVTKIIEVAYKKVPTVLHILDAPRGVYYRVGNPSRLHQFYMPKISLEEGIARAFK